MMDLFLLNERKERRGGGPSSYPPLSSFFFQWKGLKERGWCFPLASLFHSFSCSKKGRKEKARPRPLTSFFLSFLFLSMKGRKEEGVGFPLSFLSFQWWKGRKGRGWFPLTSLSHSFSFQGKEGKRKEDCSLTSLSHSFPFKWRKETSSGAYMSLNRGAFPGDFQWKYWFS